MSRLVAAFCDLEGRLLRHGWPVDRTYRFLRNHRRLVEESHGPQDAQRLALHARALRNSLETLRSARRPNRYSPLVAAIEEHFAEHLEPRGVEADAPLTGPPEEGAGLG